MTKKHFIAMADAIRADGTFTDRHLAVLVDAFKRINPNFNTHRWLGYIAGTNGPSGGAI